MPTKMICRNKRALRDYIILETLEAGLVLQGSEVKSLRAGRANLKEGFARLAGGEAFLHNLHISPYEPANRYNHDPTRTRKLLLHKKEILRLLGKVQEKGLALIPLDLHFSDGVAKVTLAVARGKKLVDRREDLRRRVADREVARALRARPEGKGAR